MTERKRISDVLSDGVMSMMNSINAEKVSQLFETEQDIKDFDALFMSSFADRRISYNLNYYYEKSQVSTFLSAILSRSFDGWLRIKTTLAAEYDATNPSDRTRTITETRNEKGTNSDTETTQENSNAFDGDEPSNTNGSERNGESERDITTTYERTESESGDSGYAKSSLVEQEVNMRKRQRFYDIVAIDLAEMCCAVIYE